MKDIKEYEKDLASIRTMMDRTAKFISLSGLSGVLAGVYALAGAAAAYLIVGNADTRPSIYAPTENDTLVKLLFVAGLVLVASVATGLFLSNKKAHKHGLTLWTTASRSLVINLSIPLITGGVLSLSCYTQVIMVLPLPPV
jgi:hypothetical protein